MTTREERLEAALREMLQPHGHTDDCYAAGAWKCTERCRMALAALMSKNAEKIDRSAAPPEEPSQVPGANGVIYCGCWHPRHKPEPCPECACLHSAAPPEERRVPTCADFAKWWSENAERDGAHSSIRSYAAKVFRAGWDAALEKTDE